MPNYCNNTLTLRHKEPAMIERAFRAIEKGDFFREFAPLPQELSDTVSGGGFQGYQKELVEFQNQLNMKYFGAKDWYDWCLKNWGTKWDVCDPLCKQLDAHTVEASFETAWSPPIEFYAKLEQLGFEVIAYYFEGGMGFCGHYEDGNDDFYQIDGDAEWVRKHIPRGIDDEFLISDSMEEWEEDERENQKTA